MSKSLFDPTPERKITQNRFQIKDTRQKPLAFRWWQPDCMYCDDLDDDDNCASSCTGDEPELDNDWLQPTNVSGLEKFAFRLHADGSLEFKGHLNAENASSGTVAFTLPGMNTGEVNFLPEKDQYWHTTITTDDGATFFLAMVFIDSTTGEVTITWPAS